MRWPQSEAFALVAQTVEAAGLDPARWGFESLREYSCYVRRSRTSSCIEDAASSTGLVVWTPGSHPGGAGSIPAWSTRPSIPKVYRPVSSRLGREDLALLA